MQNKLISFVIPVYRNEGALSLTYQKIRTLFDEELAERYELEIVFVDDGSDDGSYAELLALRSEDNHVKVIRFTRNFGQMSAILAGFKQAAGDIIINISADLQDPTDLIPQMIRRHEEGSQMVICYRTDREDDYQARWFSKIAYWFFRLSNPDLPPGGFDFVLLDRAAVDTFNSIDVRNRFFQGDLLWAGYSTSMIPYTRKERSIGKSQYTFWKKLKYFLDALLDSSYLPIRFISAVGSITAILGFFYAIAVVISWLAGTTPFAGWAPIIICILVVGGLNMLMLGIVGEYVWRIYAETRKKPNYIIRDILA